MVWSHSAHGEGENVPPHPSRVHAPFWVPGAGFREPGGPSGRSLRRRGVLDVGSGNGYWAYMLRRHGLRVHAIDNMQSSWRTLWIGDVIVQDGARYLREREGCRESVLLMVYPVVGEEFTKKVVDAYAGDVIVIAGTPNRDGYTAFKDTTIDDWTVKEKKQFTKVIQIALSSFAGKDEALFIFQRSEIK